MDRLTSSDADPAAHVQPARAQARVRTGPTSRKRGPALAPLTLGEMTQGLLFAHWRILAALILLGAALGALVGTSAGPSYTATTRIQLSVADPQTQAESSALADGARAIVTSPGHVAAAISAAHVQRDAIAVARNISVQPLGMSSVVQLQVRDVDPQVAARLAQGLADDLVQTRESEATTAQQAQLLSDINAQLKTVAADISQLDAQVDALAGQTDTGSSSAVAVLTARRSTLAQQQLALDNQRASLLSSESQHWLPTIIDAAAVPTRADAGRRIPDALLGAFAGLVVALLVAGMLETLWPTVAGPRAVARLLGAPFFGDIAYRWDEHALTGTGLVGRRLQTAAARANVQHVVLLPAGRQPSLDGLMSDLLPKRRKPFTADALRITSSIRELAPPGGNDDGSTAAVVVVAGSLKRHHIEELSDTLQISGSPLLGVIGHSVPSNAAFPSLQWIRHKLPRAQAV